MAIDNLKIKVEIFAVIPFFEGLFYDKVLRSRHDDLIGEILGMSNPQIHKLFAWSKKLILPRS